MRAAALPALALGLIAAASVGPVAEALHGITTLLVVADGSFFYDSDGDCVGDTDQPASASALRTWTLGVPMVGPSLEPGGTGCLGGPRAWTFMVEAVPDHHGRIEGTLRYTHDANAGTGGGNDVHLHVFDASGMLVTSTLTSDGPAPLSPLDGAQATRSFRLTIEPGTYTLVEDVLSGLHTSWVANFVVYEA